MIEFLSSLPNRLIAPRAILIVSAHWEASQPTLTSAARPGLVYDYHGFPPEAYEIEYDAAGDPELAAELCSRLVDAGIPAAREDRRGFDHGMFVPLKLMYPDARIPCVQLSLVEGLDPRTHIDVGRAISGLLDDDVLVIGSGMSFHNMQAFRSQDADEVGRGLAFDDWLVEACTNVELPVRERERRLVEWEKAPHARFCHPREEHLIPLHVCFGVAAERGSGFEVAYRDELMGRRMTSLVC
jgi:aromatic ring-opening dioxygenase catalytic subunit (LigB family)